MNKVVLALPLLVFLGFVGVGILGLGHEKAAVVQHAGKPAPDFSLPLLEGKGAFTKTDLAKGQLVLVNYFASWCAPCIAEHEFWGTVKGTEIPLIGIGYKDKPEKLKGFLQKHGNPYKEVAVDAEGRTAIEWGVTGVPETFLLDGKGTILSHFAGPMSREVWEKHFVPFISKGGATP